MAEELAIRRIVFPLDASTLSARGILDADIEHAFARSSIRLFDATTSGALLQMAADMRAQAKARLDADGIQAADRTQRLSADLRYKGQAFELTVPWDDDAFDAAGIAAVSARFHDQHEQRFSYANRHDSVEIVTLRLVAIGHLRRAQTTEPAVSGDGHRTGSRKVFVTDTWQEIDVWRRDQLGSTANIQGPAIIEEDYTTIYLAPGWALVRGPGGHLIAHHTEAHA